MENDNTVLLNPPLFALDKDAPLHYAGNTKNSNTLHEWEVGGKREILTKKCDLFVRFPGVMHEKWMQCRKRK